MTSNTPALSSYEQTNLNTLLSALPDQHTVVNCNTYQTYRPIIMAATPLIEKMPVVGPKIATALQFLIQMGDSFCPSQRQQATPSTGSANSTAFDLLKASGILSPDVTLDQLTELQRKMKMSALPAGNGVMVYNSFVVSLD